MPRVSRFQNGGVFGKTLDFTDTNSYSFGSTNKMNSGIWNLPAVYDALTGPAALFEFTNHTFTNASSTGYDGPTLANCTSAYSAKAWASNTSFFNMTYQGIQEFTIPKTGTYRITAAGAQGGYHSYFGVYGGYGAKLRIDVPLTQGDILNIVVGQAGVYGGVTGEGTGGGGGSFVWKKPVSGTGIGGNDLIIAAGGGGGTDDTTGTYGQQSGETTGGSSVRNDFAPTLYNNYTVAYTNNGNDGAWNAGSYAYGPGAGWLNDYYYRNNDPTYLTAGKTLSSPYFQGGTSPGYSGGSVGGFGGGGANYDDGGAGGGFTGGSTTSSVGGGAGGSYYAGSGNAYYTSSYENLTSNYSWVGVNGTNSGGGSNHGYVTIEFVA